MTPDLEQLADEAIRLRTACIDSAIEHLHIPVRDWTAPGADHLQATRDLLTTNWDRRYPALAQLAAQRSAQPAGAA